MTSGPNESLAEASLAEASLAEASLAEASLAEPSLAEQRRILRRRLLLQRQLIAQQLASIPDEHTHFPDSVTMRLLNRLPTFAIIQLLLALTALLKKKP